MQKKRLLTFILGLFMISFVSAYGSYSSFSLGELLDGIDSSTMILGGLFIIFFAMSNFALVRAFKGNKAVAGIVSFVVSLFAVYGLNKTGFDFEGLFYGFGVSEDLLYTALPIILLIGTIILIWKITLGPTLMVLGGLLILITVFTEIIYENGIAMVMGAGLLLLGLWLWQRSKKKQAGISGPGISFPSFSTIFKILLFAGVIYIYVTTSNLVMTLAALVLFLLLMFATRNKTPKGPSGPGFLRRGASKAWDKRPRYDREKEKAQAKKIKEYSWKGAKGVVKGGWGATKGVAKGAGWIGKKAYQQRQKQEKELQEKLKAKQEVERKTQEKIDKQQQAQQKDFEEEEKRRISRQKQAQRKADKDLFKRR